MQVAFLVGSFPKTSETFILDQVTGLLTRGIDVDIYAERPDANEQIHPDFFAYKLQDRVTYPLPGKNSKWYRLFHFPKMFFWGVRLNPLSVIKSLNFFKYGLKALSLTLFYEIIPLLPKKKYDIIHSHFGQEGVKAQTLRDLGILEGKLITSFHGHDISTHLKLHGESIYNSLFTKCDLFLPISNFWRKKLIALGCKNHQIRIHHMGIDGNSFKFHPKISFKNKKVINVLSIARLIEKKGLEFSIKAIAKTLKTFSNIKYTIIGDGLLRSNLQNLLKKLNVEDNIDMVGWKNRKEVIGALENADIFLAPSVTASNGDMEGIPVVLMEAMAIGIPVISTLHSGIPELIKNKETGFIVPERDIDAISKIIEKMLINKFDLSTITKNARTLIEKKFNVNKQVDELTELYKTLTKLKNENPYP